MSRGKVYPLRNGCALVLGHGIELRLPDGHEFRICQVSDAADFCAAARELGEDAAAMRRDAERRDLSAAHNSLADTIRALAAKLDREGEP